VLRVYKDNIRLDYSDYIRPPLLTVADVENYIRLLGKHKTLLLVLQYVKTDIFRDDNSNNETVLETI
jgi:hypothetical protein